MASRPRASWPSLGALPDDSAIDLRLNSPGGSVFDAVAIHNALSRHAGPVTVWIDGIAASAASYIAMAGDEIVMPENAFLMIHDPSGMVIGTAADMRDMAGTLDKIAGSMLRGYAARSGKPEDEIAALMAAETWFDAAEALEAGSPRAWRSRCASPPASISRASATRRRSWWRRSSRERRTTARRPTSLQTPTMLRLHPCAGHAPRCNGRQGATPVAGQHPRSPAPHVPDRNMPPEHCCSRQHCAGRHRHPRRGHRPCPRRGRSLPPRGPAADGRALPRRGRQPRRGPRRAAGRPAEAEPEITPHHPQPGRSATTRPWGDVIARTFKLKG